MRDVAYQRSFERSTLKTAKSFAVFELKKHGKQDISCDDPTDPLLSAHSYKNEILCNLLLNYSSGEILRVEINCNFIYSFKWLHFEDLK